MDLLNNDVNATSSSLLNPSEAPYITLSGHNFTTTSLNEIYVVGEIPWNVRIIGALVGLTLTLTCIPGNILLMIVSVTKPLDKKAQRFKTNFAGQLVFSLAVSDTYFLIVSGFLSVYTYFKGTWTFGPAVCTLLFVTRQACHTLAVEHIEAISFVRYLAVVHRKIIAPRWYITTVVLVMMYSIPTALVIAFIPERLVFLPRTMTCLSFETATRQQENYAVVNTASVLLVVAVVLIFFYLHIYIHVRRSRASIHDIQNRSENDDQARLNLAFIKRELKLIRTTAYVFFLFSLTYPVTSVILAIDKNMEWSYGLHYICVATDTLTAGLNWIIYGVTIDWIRKRYGHIVSCKFCSDMKKPSRVAPAETGVAPGTLAVSGGPSHLDIGVATSSTYSIKLPRVCKVKLHLFKCVVIVRFRVPTFLD